MRTTTEGEATEVFAGAEAAAGTYPVTVQTANGAITFDCHRGEPILLAGLRNGVSLPYACATGTCGSCRLRGDPTAVDVTWQEAPGLAKLKSGREILLCQSVGRGALALESRTPLAPWRPDLPHPDHGVGRIVSRRPIARDVLSVRLRLSQPLAFLPGQFVLLRRRGIAGYRAYSPINAESPTAVVDFVVRRKPGGRLSDWLFAPLVDDGTVEVFGPLGSAVLAGDEDADLLVIAGSTGIAGPMAILDRAALDGRFSRRRADVFFGVRTLADAFCLDNLADLIACSPERVRVTLALSEQVPAGRCHPTLPAIALAHGDVHAVAQQQIGGPRRETIAFVAGPPPMVDAAIRLLLTTARLPPTAIRYDRFW